MGGVSRSMAMARVIALRSDYSDDELLEQAVRWHCVNPRLAWQWREAWAIRCIEGVAEGVQESGQNA